MISVGIDISRFNTIVINSMPRNIAEYIQASSRVARDEDGIVFTRMYTEPSCTPTRAAALTGRLAVRSGMHTVSFPPEGAGLPAEEVTIAEILSDAGYNTGFVGKGHQGDIEEAHLHNQGFDEATFSMYNQFPPAKGTAV